MKKSKIILFAVIVCLFVVLIVGYKQYTQKNNQPKEVEKVESVESSESIEENKLTDENPEVENEINENSKPESIKTDNTKNTEESTEKTEEIIKEDEKNTEQTENPTENLVNLGRFKLTAYCNCKKCCGKWAGGATASGVMPKANHTIAVDPRIIPLGTSVIINGHTYVAEDTGGAIKGNRIDIYFNSHQEALNFGVRYAEVYKIIQ